MQLKYFFLFASLQFAARSMAQNIPILSQNGNPNAFTNMATPAEVYNGVGPGMLNSVTTLVPTIQLMDTSSANSGSSSTEVMQQVEYLDGFNKPFLSVTKNIASNNGVNKNLIQIYDNRPQRERYSFLPYSSNDPGINATSYQDQKTYYNSLFPNEGYSSFSKIINTSNGTERSTSSYSAGRSGVGLEYGNRIKSITNSASQVIRWGLDGNGLPITLGYYNAGVLSGTESADADAAGSNQSVSSPRTKVYKDNEGKIILKMVADSSYSIPSGNNINAGTLYAYTYYVYDTKGNLRVTITPKAYKYYQMQGSLSSTILNNLCFQNQYDSKGRICGTKKPGESDYTYTVYDRKDRPVMRQTPNERLSHEWEINFMDALGRTKVTSIYTDVQSSQLDHIMWQNTIDSWLVGGNYSDLLNYLITPNMESQYPVGNNPVSDPNNNAFGGNYIAHNNIMTINYYDNYLPFDTTNTLYNECIDTLNLPYVTVNGQEPVIKGRTYGSEVGSIIRILRSPNALTSTKVGDWRTTINFNDDKGRVIASKSFVTDDVNTGHQIISSDYSGVQYDFSNHALISGHVFNNFNSRDNSLTRYHSEYTKNQYDNLTGKIIKSVHQVDGHPWKTLGTYQYDDMGRLQRHTLGAGGEVQDMTYNIRGEVIGINSTYAETANKGGFSKTFGESLKYDYGFSKPRYDGKIAGVVWRGSSALDMYAYGYDYNQNGALKTADFNHTENGVWKHTTMDYSVSNLFYDKNGNITHMKQRGSFNGNVVTAPFDMDDLSYTYESGDISNRLSQVTENATIGDYGAGDFRGTANDTYDANGNLITNTGTKNITGISYTRFNKPVMISYANSSSIEYSYDALGNKVEELIIDKPNVKRKRTDYIGNCVYKTSYLTSAGDGGNADSLQYISTSDGRTTFDYSDAYPIEEFYVKDHLGNVRSNINVSGFEITNYLATYELASAHLEDLVFDNVEDIRDIRPGGDGDNTMAANLNGSDPNRIIGSSLLVHVMAGDKVGMNVSTLYNDYDASGDEPLDGGTVLNSVITTLTGGVGGFEGSESHNTKIVESIFTPENYSALNDAIQNSTDDSKPKAYLNYALFDERMQLVREMSGAFQATGNGDWALVGTSAPLEVPTNGYLAVYLSNTSKSEVWFDQLAIDISHGNLLEENHYYPHGLPIFGLGSVTTSTVYKDNRKKYQTNEYITDLGLNWMSFDARQYDPQIGRFLSVDPLSAFNGQEVYSPFAAMGNQPESSIDPNGMIVNFGSQWNFHPMLANADGGQSAGGFASSGWFGITNGNDMGMAQSLTALGNVINIIGSNNFSTVLSMVGSGNSAGTIASDYQSKSGEFAATTDVGGIYAAVDRNSKGDRDYYFQKGSSPAISYKSGVTNGVSYKLSIYQGRDMDNGQNGANFEAWVKGRGLEGYKNLNWIQTIKESRADGEVGWHWDGRDQANYPFYNPKDLNEYSKTRARQNGYSQFFSDFPTRGTSINTVWTAQTTLVGQKNGVYQAIISFTWGFNYESFESYKMPAYIIPNSSLNPVMLQLIKSLNTNYKP